MTAVPPLTPAEQAAYVEIYAIAHNSELLLPQMGEGATCGGCQSMARAAVAAVRPIVEDPYARTVAKLATALDQLGSRISTDFASEYAEIHTGDVAKTVDGFNTAAEEFLAVLNDPEVRSVVDAALSRPTSEETRDDH